MIDVALTLEEVRGIPLAGVTAIVLDIVRASTTIVAALAGGARAVRPVATPEEALAVGRRDDLGPALIGGERGGSPPPGFDHGNSPAEYTPDRVIAWAHLGGHRWRYMLEPADGGTLVTEQFDWSTAKVPWAIEKLGYPRKHPAAMRKTLDRLADVLAGRTADAR